MLAHSYSIINVSMLASSINSCQPKNKIQQQEIWTAYCCCCCCCCVRACYNFLAQLFHVKVALRSKGQHQYWLVYDSRKPPLLHMGMLDLTIPANQTILCLTVGSTPCSCSQCRFYSFLPRISQQQQQQQQQNCNYTCANFPCITCTCTSCSCSINSCQPNNVVSKKATGTN